MRYAGPARISTVGNRRVADAYRPLARKFVGLLFETASYLGMHLHRQVRLENGIVITVTKQPFGFVDVIIDARSQITAPTVVELKQYQFVCTGDFASSWDVEPLPPLAKTGGSLVGVLFVRVVEQDGSQFTDFFAVPLVSSIYDPALSVSSNWEYTPDIDPIVWQTSAIVPRLEVAHANPTHSIAPDIENMVYAPWMPPGCPHYMAQTATQATRTPSLIINGSIQGQNIVYDDTWLDYSVETDVTYETPLAVYDPPQYEPNTVAKGSISPSAPDADWYGPSTRRLVESDLFGAREFGILIDAKQQVHVWPTSAAGTATPPPSIPFISTNVSDQFTRRAQITFPPSVVFSSVEFRTAISDPWNDNIRLGGPVQGATRYVWAHDSQGKNWAVVASKETAPLFPVEANTLSPVVGADPLFLRPGVPYVFHDPVVCEFSLEIEITGPNPNDFTISISPVEVRYDDNTFFPHQVAYAKEGAYSGVEKDTLVVSGFQWFRGSTEAEDSPYNRFCVGDTTNGWSVAVQNAFHTRQSRLFCCLADRLFSVPIRLATEQWPAYSDTSAGSVSGAGSTWTTLNRAQIPPIPPYKLNDVPFSRIEYPYETHPNSGVAPTDAVLYKKSWSLEGRFQVRSGDNAVLEDVTIRKHRDNQWGMSNWFTAVLLSSDTSNNTFVFGTCLSESETELVQIARSFGLSEIYDTEATFESSKSFAVYHRGEFLREAVQEHQNYFSFDLDYTVPLTKDLTFWGSLYFAPVQVLDAPPGEIGAFVTTENTSYIAHIIPLVGGASAFTPTKWGFKEFPWGLEMNAWAQANHVNQSSFGRTVIADSEFVSFSEVFLDIQGPVAFNTSSALCDVSSAELKVKLIDYISVWGQEFTHQDLFEAAFDQASDHNLDLRFENIFRGNFYIDLGPSVGPITDPDRWLIGDIYAGVVKVTLDGSDIYAYSLSHPKCRMYCTSIAANAKINYDPSFAPPGVEPVDAYRSFGSTTPPFSGFCLSYVETS